MKRTDQEVKAEIAALKAAKGWAPHHSFFGEDNHHNIDLQIEFLEEGIDTTADEFTEFSESEQSAILEAEAWLDGEKETPHEGWDIFKPKK